MSALGRRALLVGLLAGLLVPLGCDDGDESPSATTTTASTTGPSTSTTGPGTSTTAPSTSTTAAAGTVLVFFVDQDAFNEGVPPYVAPVERRVDPADPVRGVLDALFEGPTAEERAAGLTLVTSEATGVSEVRVEDGTAHVVLAGGCSSGGSTLTVAAEIVPTLLQFTDVRAVKIYDPAGTTEEPDAPGDSIPECLEP
ncbi:MAG: GerMN domain-containing protein [Acidimicrobiia bacterium]|nr:GerMN domain-containing protein [Acidimicrobiia bacterium]